MKKKLLLSLLATAPTVLPAMADIVVTPSLIGDNGSGWIQTGITGESVFEQGGVICPIGTGVLETTLKDLAPGTYKIQLTKLGDGPEADNVSIEVEINGKVVSNGNEFTVSEKCDAKLTIKAADPSIGFQFADASLVLDYDFETEADKFKSQLPEISAVPDDVLQADKNSLSTTYNKLTGDMANIQAILGKMVEGTVKEQLDVYDKQQLWKDDNNVVTAINDLKAAVEAYNKAVEASQAKQSTLTANETQKAALESSISALQEELEGVKNTIAGMSDYAQKETKALVDAAQAAIDAAMAAVESAYGNGVDLTAGGIPTETLATLIEDAKSAIKAISDEMTAAQADWEAYRAIMNAQGKLTEDMQNAKAEVNALQGVSGHESNFDAYKEAVCKNIDTEYNTGMNAIAFGKTDSEDMFASVKGAAAIWEAGQKAYEEADAAIEALKQGAVDEINDWNEWYTKAMNAVSELQDELDKYDASLLPTENQGEVTKLIKQAQDQINALNNKVADAYKEHKEKVEYTTDVAGVENTLGQLENLLAAWEPVLELQKSLDELIEYVKGYQDESGVSPSEFDLSGKFADTFSSLQAAVDQLKKNVQQPDGSVSPAEVGEVKARFDVVKGGAEELMDAYKAASESVKTFEGYLTSLNDIIDGKKYLAADVKTGALNNTIYNDYKEQCEKFQADLKAAAAANGQECFKLSTDLEKKIKGYKTTEKYLSILNDFEAAATTGNYNVVDAALAALAADAADATGFDGGTYEGQAECNEAAAQLRTKLDQIKSDLDAAVANQLTDPDAVDDYVAGFDSIDDALEALTQEISDEVTHVKAMKDNQTAYDALMKAFEPKVQDAIDAVATFNTENSFTPATEHYANEVIGSGDDAADTTLQGRANALKAAIDAALTDHKAVEMTGDLSKAIEALIGDCSQTQNAIAQNNAKYNAQVVRSNSIRSTINSYIEQMKEADSTAGADFTTNWQAALEDLLTNDMTNADATVNTAYGKGKSVDSNSDFMTEYQRIDDAAEAIYDEYDDTFGQLVKAANDQVLENWDNKIGGLDVCYTNAIGKYNRYFTLSNTKYREYIIPFVQSHSDLFDYYTEIRKLQAEVTNQINEEYTKEKIVISKERFDEIATDKADKLASEINEAVAAMVADVNSKADAYYCKVYGEVKAKFDSTKELLVVKGVSASVVEEYTKTADSYIKQAEGIYKAEENKADFGYNPMNDIANLLYGVNIDVEGAAQAQWNLDYTNAAKTLTDYRDEIAGYNEVEASKIQECIDEASKLNEEVKADDSLIENLKGDQEELNRIVAEATTLHQNAKNAYDNDQANKEAAEGYKADIANLEMLFSELVAYSDALAGGSFQKSDVMVAVDQVSILVNRYSTELVANKTEIDAAITNAKNAIDQGYGDVRSSEIDTLVKLLSDTKEAFNNALAEDKLSTDDQTNFLDQIEEIATQIAAIQQQGVTDAEFKVDALTIEKSLSALYVEIRSKVEGTVQGGAGDPLPAIIDGLEDTYKTVSGDIETGEGALGQCLDDVQAQFAGRYDELQGELDAVRDDYMAAGSMLVLNSGKYTDEMDAISAKVTALNEEVAQAESKAQAEKARQEASNAIYATLDAELQGYEAEYNSLVELYNSLVDCAEGFDIELNTVKQWLDNSKGCIESERNRIDKLRDSYDLQPGDEINSEVSRWLNLTLIKIETDYLTVLKQDAQGRENAASTALAANVVPEKKSDLTAKLNKLYNTDLRQKVDEAQAVTRNFQNGTIGAQDYKDQMASIFDDINSLLEAIDNIREEAEANVFTLGDITLDPDHDVNVADLNMLLGWIGTGVTYQEVYADSPRMAAAADVVGDQVLNVTDVPALIQLILNQNGVVGNLPTAATGRVLAYRNIAKGDAVYGVAMTSNETDHRTYDISLSSSESFIAGQVDLTLPIGMTLTDAKLTARGSAHQIDIFDNGNGEYRLLIYSMDNSAIEGHDGDLITLTIDGIGNPSIDDMLLVTPQMLTIRGVNSGTTMLDSIMMNATNVKDRIYNVAGQAVNKILRGVNIIRHADGTTTKEMH